ncbi:hypothetical protein PCANC_28220 [Puccinia coronata f. sp. avenae]|uniref:Uncharacterized protein n=1 Tax=Puccinia coronata f. sp. avenae TaxID=200324 RepID=A0A2N5RUG2_9BASI|nr:hypothetical protein PCANC_28220 [Puccinia coronata f. sp. avenae]
MMPPDQDANIPDTNEYATHCLHAQIYAARDSTHLLTNSPQNNPVNWVYCCRRGPLVTRRAGTVCSLHSRPPTIVEGDCHHPAHSTCQVAAADHQPEAALGLVIMPSNGTHRTTDDELSTTEEGPAAVVVTTPGNGTNRTTDNELSTTKEGFLDELSTTVEGEPDELSTTEEGTVEASCELSSTEAGTTPESTRDAELTITKAAGTPLAP